MKLSKELKTAALVLAGTILFIAGFNYLKSNSLIGSKNRYYAVYDHVGGLAVGTPVTVNGLSVGTVKSIDFLNNSGKLVVSFTVRPSARFNFSKNTTAELFDNGIIGGKNIQLIPAFDDSSYAKPGDTLPSNIKPGLTELVANQLTPLEEKLGSMLENADSLIGNMNAILDEGTKFNIKRSIANLNTAIDNFTNASSSVEELIDLNTASLDSTLGNVKNITSDLSTISNSLASADIEGTITNLQKTITNVNSILTKVDNGEGALGKLLKDEKLYDDLTGASAQLELLLQDLRLNPKRYVHFSLFGRRSKKVNAKEAEELEN